MARNIAKRNGTFINAQGKAELRRFFECLVRAHLGGKLPGRQQRKHTFVESIDVVDGGSVLTLRRLSSRAAKVLIGEKSVGANAEAAKELLRSYWEGR